MKKVIEIIPIILLVIAMILLIAVRRYPKNYYIMYIIVIVLMTMTYLSVVVMTKINNNRIKAKSTRHLNNIDTANIEYDFERIYNILYSNFGCELEELRRKIVLEERKPIYILLIAIAICIILAIANDFIGVMSLLLISTIVILISAVIAMPANDKRRAKYNKDYIEKVIYNFISLIDNNLHYNDNIELDTVFAEIEYNKAAFDNIQYDNFIVSDQISGMLDGKNKIKIWDLIVQSNIETGNKYIDIFKGIFTSIECDNTISGTVKIKPKQIWNKENKINLDHNVFEKEFDVYSTDSVLTMRILTHDVMEMILEFKNKLNLEFEIVFHKNKVYIRVFLPSMFEPKITEKTMEKTKLYAEYVVFKFILNMSKKINEVQKVIE